jgi:hypothetical protein
MYLELIKTNKHSLTHIKNNLNFVLKFAAPSIQPVQVNINLVSYVLTQAENITIAINPQNVYKYVCTNSINISFNFTFNTTHLLVT